MKFTEYSPPVVEALGTFKTLLLLSEHEDISIDI